MPRIAKYCHLNIQISTLLTLLHLYNFPEGPKQIKNPPVFPSADILLAKWTLDKWEWDQNSLFTDVPELGKKRPLELMSDLTYNQNSEREHPDTAGKDLWKIILGHDSKMLKLYLEQASTKGKFFKRKNSRCRLKICIWIAAEVSLALVEKILQKSSLWVETVFCYLWNAIQQIVSLPKTVRQERIKTVQLQKKPQTFFLYKIHL